MNTLSWHPWIAAFVLGNPSASFGLNSEAMAVSSDGSISGHRSLSNRPYNHAEIRGIVYKSFLAFINRICISFKLRTFFTLQILPHLWLRYISFPLAFPSHSSSIFHYFPVKWSTQSYARLLGS